MTQLSPAPRTIAKLIWDTTVEVMDLNGLKIPIHYDLNIKKEHVITVSSPLKNVEPTKHGIRILIPFVED